MLPRDTFVKQDLCMLGLSLFTQRGKNEIFDLVTGRVGIIVLAGLVTQTTWIHSTHTDHTFDRN